MTQNWKNSAILTLGMVLSALILGSFHYQSRQAQNFVTVKGLSERLVEADRGWWSINATYGANTVQEIQSSIRWHEEKVRSFLLEAGFSTDEIQVEGINIYRNNYQGAQTALNADVKISVNTRKVGQITAASERIGELIAEGILVSSDKWATGPKYYFTDFKNLKTEMLAEATQEAKKAAEEFARNSGTKVGKIRRANQGIFQIIPGNRTSENEEFFIDKVVRVVSTVDYYLE